MVYKNKCSVVAKKTNDNHDKRFIRVIADMRPNAQIIPLKIVADDGRDFAIQNVFSIVRTIVEDIGEQCMAYHIIVNDTRKVIYLDKNFAWFVM